MYEELEPVIEKLRAWILHHILTLNTLFDLIIVAVSFVAGSLVARYLRAKATKAIEASKLPIRTKRIAKNSRRVIFPAVSLVFLFIIAKIASSDWIGLDVSLSETIMKVLLAWIAIKLSFQFIDNAAIRNVITWTIWVAAALSIFGVLDQTMAAMDTLSLNIGTFHVSMLEVIKGLLLLVILLYAAQVVSSFFERKVLKSKSLSRSSQVLIVKIIRMSLIVVAIIIGTTSSGIDLSIFAVFSGAVGLGLGFGLQKVASNLFSGLLLLMDQSVKPGDVIELAPGTYGWVNQMAARYTEVVTRENKSYLIPNEDFITNRIVNWSHGNSLIRLEVFFGVHYDSDPHQVIKIALEVARNMGGRVAADPKAQCYLRAFGDSSIDFTLRFWISDAEHGVTNIKGAILLGLWDAFKANGISIPYPHRELFIHNKT